MILDWGVAAPQYKTASRGLMQSSVCLKGAVRPSDRELHVNVFTGLRAIFQVDLCIPFFTFFILPYTIQVPSSVLPALVSQAHAPPALRSCVEHHEDGVQPAQEQETAALCLYNYPSCISTVCAKQWSHSYRFVPVPKAGI